MRAGYPTLIEITNSGLFGDPGKNRFFTSLEGENASGSIKDHLVRGQMDDWEREGKLSGSSVLAEASAGSTGYSLAYFAREIGCRCVIFLPASLPEEALAQTQSRLLDLGAEVRVAPFQTIMSDLESFAASHPEVLCLNQMRGREKRRFYGPLAARIQQELPRVDVLVGAVGTGHSLLGLAESFEERPLVVSAEPAGHSVPGVRNLSLVRFESDPVDENDFDRRIEVESSNAISFDHDDRKVHAGASFDLVIRATRKFLERPTAPRVFFLVGSSNFRDRRP